MDYEEWIGREHKIRSSLLLSSSDIQNKGICRVCQDCGEVCLCHEITCPNCGGNEIMQEQSENIESEIISGRRIRCQLRFKKIFQIEE